MIKHCINEIMWQATDPEEILAIYVVKGLALSIKPSWEAPSTW